MYLKQCSKPAQQKGFLIPVAIFIVVGLAGLAVAISRLTSGSFSTSVQEAVVVQALYAAESGAQYAMHELLFDVADATEADANCTSVNGGSISYTAVGLSGCSTQITCAKAGNSGGSANIYNLSSAASCGGGDITAERTIAVRAIYEE